jgi:hypothetical protein
LFAYSASDLTEGARGKFLALFDADALSQAIRDGDQDSLPKKNDRRNRVERRPKFREEARQGGPLEECTFRASWMSWHSLFHSSVHNNNQRLNLTASLSKIRLTARARRSPQTCEYRKKGHDAAA